MEHIKIKIVEIQQISNLIFNFFKIVPVGFSAISESNRQGHQLEQKLVPQQKLAQGGCNWEKCDFWKNQKNVKFSIFVIENMLIDDRKIANFETLFSFFRFSNFYKNSKCINYFKKIIRSKNAKISMF